MTILKLRPHHLLCILCFRGKGYSQEFIENFKEIYGKLKSAPTTMIEIVNGCDDVCEKCPEKQDNLCRQHQIVADIDNAYLKLLRLKIGQNISFKSLRTKIKKLLTIESFQKTCHQCSWYRLNICAPIIQNLLLRKK